jgi:transposase
MSMGTREDGKQPPIWVETSEIARGEGHVFYRRLNELLGRHGFDAFVEKGVSESGVFAEGVGRPSIPPGIYFRMMFAGFFEGLSSERAIGWKCADSFSLREFLGYGLTDATPDHSTLSGLRRRFPEALHREVFDWVLKVAAEEGLLKGRKVAIDATTLEANAAMRTIVRRADGASYQKYLKKLARAEGIQKPTPQDLGRMDRKRKGKKVSNSDWKSPTDPDARITKMKDGTTHLAHKAEHAVDLDSGVIVAAEIQPADSGDTATLPNTLKQAQAAVERANPDLAIEEIVTDCGYHSAETLGELHGQGLMTCIPERRSKGRRGWKRLACELGPEEARRRQRAFYQNRRRVKSSIGRRLLGRRGETIERSFAHLCETGGLRRLHLRGRENISKRYQVHAGAANLGMVLRRLIGTGTPRGFQGSKGLLRALLHALSSWIRLLPPLLSRPLAISHRLGRFDSNTLAASLLLPLNPNARLSTGC